MDRIGFAIEEESPEDEKQQEGYAEGAPATEVEEEPMGYGYWLFRACTDFLMVYGLVAAIKNVADYVRKV